MPATIQQPALPPDLYGVSPYQADPFPDSEFVNKTNVPVFAEHETTTRDGRKLNFGYAELAAVADRCNRRIQETGDYAALSIGHNPEPEAKLRGALPPKNVGYAGPFRVGTINGQDGTKKVAILADLHYFKTDWEEAKRYGRRSAELWVEDRYEEMFLDPIALLGAETPRLDLGLVYSKLHPGKQILKYAAGVEPYTAVFPGSFNTHGPKPTGLKEDYGMDTNPAPNPATMNQPDFVKAVVDALCALPQWQYLESMMAQGEAEGANDPAMGMGMDPTGSVGDAQADPNAQAQPPMLPAGGPQGNPPSPPPPAASPTAGGPPSAEPSAPEMPSPPQAREQTPPTKEPPQKNALPSEETSLSPSKAGQILKDKEVQGHPLTDAQRGFMGAVKNKEKNSMPAVNYQAALYAAMDQLDDESLQYYVANRKKKGYQAEVPDGETDGENAVKADAGTYEQSAGSAPGVSAEGEKTIKESGAEEPSSTGKADYSRSNAQTLKYQLDDVTMRLKKMEAAREEERRGRIDAERRQRLQEYQHQGFLPGDINKAMERLCYAKIADDKQFDDMLEMMLENAPARIPLGLSLPNVEGAERYNKHRPGFKDEQSEKYSKEVQETAKRNVTRRINAAAERKEMLDTKDLWAEELEKAASLNGAA